MINVKYTGTMRDCSGYGQANRTDVVSLFMAGVSVSTELVTQTTFSTDFGILGKICDSLLDRDIDYRIKIIHLTPDLYTRYMEPGKYHIGRLFWETDKLPDRWAEECNKMNEIWTASEQQAEMMRKSGVKVPVYNFPESLLTQTANEKIIPFETQHKKDFTFYSIFQWIDRKNPRGLLRAYWQAFEGKDDITLLLKTYRGDYSDGEFDKIKADIQNWKKEMKQNHFPKILLVKKILPYKDMPKLHTMGDCYINASSGEGWCRPMQEAMLYGKPAISGSNGGITDIIPTSCYFNVPGATQKVTEQLWIPYYRLDQNWKVLNEDALIKTMKNVYNNYQDAIVVADRAKQFVIDNFSLDKVGQQMRNRLEKI